MNITRFSRMQPLGCLALLLVAASTFGQPITTVIPASAAQGTAKVLVTFTLAAGATPVPPAGAPVTSVTLGTIAGSSVTHASQYLVTAQFTIPALETVGWKDAAVVFSPPEGGTLTCSKTAAFQVTAGSRVAASFTGTPTSGKAPLTVSVTDASSGTITNRLWSFGDSTTSSATHPVHTYTHTGCYTWYVAFGRSVGTNGMDLHGAGAVRFDTKVAGGPAGEGGERYTNFVRLVRTDVAPSTLYPVVGTAQVKCYNDTTEIAPPAAGQPFYGQDAQGAGIEPSYTLSGDGLTVVDNRTGQTWQRSPDTSGDGDITSGDKLNWANAQLRSAVLNAANHGGYSDWRLPAIKELYSLILFNGTDPSGLQGTDTSSLTPFIDTNYFKFAYGDTGVGERIIDSQYASSTLYVSTVDGTLLFGVNFADGRIKGYGLIAPGGGAKTFFVQCVRGNTSCGINQWTSGRISPRKQPSPAVAGWIG